MPRKTLPIIWLLAVAAILIDGVPGPAQFGGRARPATADSAPAISGVFPPAATIGRDTDCTVSGRSLKDLKRLIVSGEGVAVVGVKPKADASATITVRVAVDAEPGIRELRAIGPGGFSNFVLFRIDTLPQVVEVEPNDDPAKANEVAIGTAVAGVLKPQDLDHFRVQGRSGRRITIEVEAQRLGTPIAPVVTVLSPSGTAMAQGRETRGLDHDCRMTFPFPGDGAYVIQVRDNVYSGAETAAYRLRLEEAPFATGLFPLGGPQGRPIAVTASGGNLTEPRSKTLTLPDEPGSILDPGAFDGPGGPVLSPAKLMVGDGPEVFEAPAGISPSPFPIGTTANGRIDRPGEVDRYLVPAKKGESIQVRVRAADLGSWLDSVVTVRDSKGNVLAENDDAGETPNTNNGPFFINQNFTTSDSRLDYRPSADGDLTVEVADRYGDGGPEYAYRLEVGPSRPDFAIRLLIGDINQNRRRVVFGGQPPVINTPGATGALNLQPGTTTPINFLITPEGNPGPIEVRAEGLPIGVTAAPVTIKLVGSVPTGRTTRPAPPVGGALLIKVDAGAGDVVGDLRVVATAKPEGSVPMRRVATASLVLNPVAPPAFSRPITRVVSILPVRVLGTPGANPWFVGPPKPVKMALKSITIPGLLFQGDKIDFTLNLDPPHPNPEDFHVEAETEDAGMVTQTFPPDPSPSASAPDGVATIVRVLAAVDIEPGVKTVKIQLTPAGNTPIVREVPVVVRPPMTIRAHPGPVVLAPGKSARLWVGVRRELGFDGPVELKFEGLPQGIEVVGKTIVPPDQPGREIGLEMSEKVGSMASPVALRVAGLARMPRGPVRVDSAIRPMLRSRPADK